MFLVFEGLDGAGKSTLIQGLATHLEAVGQPFHITREPGGTALGEDIRTMLITPSENAPTSRAELLLYEASRAQHVDKIIRPHLEKKHWVISDRYSASTLAFQAGGRSIDLNQVRQLNDFATDGVMPDLWVLLDLTVEEATRRMQGRELDRFEQEAQDFHERVRQAYLAEAKRDQSHWLVLNAAEPANQLTETLIQALKDRQWLE